MQEIICRGAYEISEMKILPGFISSKDTVLEIGGAIGFIGLYCRKVVGVKDCVSVEPNPTTLRYLRRNYDLNGFKPSVIEAALSETDGPVPFQTSDMFWVDSLLSRSDAPATKTITVEGLSFASIVKRAGIHFNTVIIDIEGGEQFLPIQLLPASVEKVLIEIHPELIGPRQAYKVIESLVRSGFEMQDHFANAWALKRTL
jgi:FkbM family methyltransferase